jgi:hypothetical protein
MRDERDERDETDKEAREQRGVIEKRKTAEKEENILTSHCTVATRRETKFQLGKAAATAIHWR